MRIKRLLAALITAVLVAQLVPQKGALGEVAISGEAEQTYKYVAIGDGVTSGLNLTPREDPYAPDKAMVLTEELIADPVQEAYPAVFGNMLSGLGNNKGYVTNTINLGTTAYSAEDVEHTILEEGYKGKCMSLYLMEGTPLDMSEPLAAYHDIFEKYLPGADLVSVQLGGNDLWMSPILPLMQSDNPVMQIFGISLAMILGGSSVEEVEQTANYMIDYYQDNITPVHIFEALNAVLQLSMSGDEYISEAAGHLESVVQLVKARNPDADIAILGFYNPYKDSPEGIEELNNTIEIAFDDIIAALVENTPGVQNNPQLEVFAKQIVSHITSEFTADSFDVMVSSFNQDAQQVARRQGATYIDTMDIVTGDDSNPYPPAEGHRQIADRMWNALSSKIADKMTPAPTPAPQPTPGAPSVSYAGHQQTYGDLAAVSDGATLGHIGESKRLESVTASVSGIEGASISYRGHVQGIGWTDWVADGALCGTTGQSKRVEALQMRLSGADGWHVWYRVHSQTWGWLGWAKDGEAAGTAGQSRRIEAVEVRVLRDGETPEGYVQGQASFVGYASGEAHVQGVGWTGAVPAGTLGTTGEGRRVEAFRLRIANQPLSGGIEYEAHVQGVGWQGYRADGELAGTEGQSKRVEAVWIRLTGPMADSGAYSVWYRVHSQSYGWLGWAKDGADAGTQGLSKRAEAIEVQIIPAGQVPVGYDRTRLAFVHS